MSSEIFHSKVVSFASYIPNQFVPLNDYASINHLPGKLDLHRLTGLEGHRKSKVEEGSLELSVKAAETCIARGNINPEDIDLVVNCAMGKIAGNLEMHLSPSLASLIARRLGIENATCFDMSNACSGMLTSIMLADSMIKSGEIKYALIVSGENVTSLIDEAKSNNLWLKSQAIASLTVGDGSAAYLIGRTEVPNQLMFSEPFTLAQYTNLCIGEAAKKRAGPSMRTKASQLQQGVLDNLGEFLGRAMRDMSLDWEKIEHIYSHPTSPKSMRKGGRVAEAALGKMKNFHNESHDIGNTGSTSHCMLLEKSVQAGDLKSGESTLLISFGSGLAMLAMHMMMPEGIEEWS